MAKSEPFVEKLKLSYTNVLYFEVLTQVITEIRYQLKNSTTYYLKFASHIFIVELREAIIFQIIIFNFCERSERRILFCLHTQHITQPRRL